MSQSVEPASASAPSPDASIALVVIGRNEGERLRRCLKSALPYAARLVYVDSGSTDGSVEMARALGVEVVELERGVPFTAARARNAGFARVQQGAGVRPEFVQFVDGDCEIQPTWWGVAAGRLRERSDLAIVCGRRRERFPEATKYNLLCDIEWNTPVGEALASGGDFMCRSRAMLEADGFNPSLIAGEEPELCFRLREKGWRIERLDAEMTLHDAAMTRFGQWWKREKRAGYAAAEGAAMHGRSPERYRVQMNRSNWIWGAVIPLAAISAAWFTYGISLALFLVYPAQYLRLRRGLCRQRGLSAEHAGIYATYLLLGKLPQMSGQLKYWTDRLFHRPQVLIEYKAPTPPAEPRIVKA